MRRLGRSPNGPRTWNFIAKYALRKQMLLTTVAEDDASASRHLLYLSWRLF